VVVTVGLKLVDPVAEVEVKLPGVMAILVAPVVVQASVLLKPEAIFVGLAVKESIVGLLGGVKVTVTVDVLEPTSFVAVSV
jgi:hypothetical protein